MTPTERVAENTDRELWREPTDQIGHEYYQPSIHVTATGGIGINVGGFVFVKTLRAWHALAVKAMESEGPEASGKAEGESASKSIANSISKLSSQHMTAGGREG